MVDYFYRQLLEGEIPGILLIVVDRELFLQSHCSGIRTFSSLTLGVHAQRGLR